MTETSRMIASLLGIVLGAGVGATTVYAVFKQWEPIYKSPLLMFLAVIVLGGGFAVLGGWLALFLMTKYGRSRRKRVAAAKKTERFAINKPKRKKK